MTVKIVQINTNRSRAVIDVISKTVEEEHIHLVIEREEVSHLDPLAGNEGNEEEGENNTEEKEGIEEKGRRR